MSNAVTEWKETKSHIEQLVRERQNLQEELSCSRTTSQTLSDQKSIMATTHAAEIEQHQSLLASTQRRVEVLKSEKDDVFNDLFALEEENSKLQYKLKNVQKEYDSLKETHHAEIAVRDEAAIRTEGILTAMESEREELLQNMENLNYKISILENLSIESSRKVDESKKQLEEKEQERKALELMFSKERSAVQNIQEELNAILQTKEKSLSVHSETLQEYKSTVEFAKQQVEEFKSERDDYKSKLSAVDKELSETRSKIESFENNQSRLEKSAAETNLAMKEVEDERNELQEKMLDLTNQHSMLKQQIGDARNDLKVARNLQKRQEAESSRIEQQLAAEKRLVEGLKRELSKLSEEKEEIVSSHAKALQDHEVTIENARTEMEDLKFLHQQQQAKLSELEAMHMALQKSQQETTKQLEKVIQERDESVRSSQAAIQSLQDEKQLLSDELQDVQKRLAERTDLLSKREEEVRSAEKKIQTLQQEQIAAASAVALHSVAVENHQRSSKVLEEQLKEAQQMEESARMKLDDIKERLDSVEKERESAILQNDEMAKKLEEALLRLAKAEEENAILHQKLANSEAEVDQLKSDQSRAANEKADMLTAHAIAIQAAEKNLQESQVQLRILREEQADLQKNADTLLTDRDALSSQVEAMNSSIESTKLQLKNAEEECVQLRSSLQQSEQQVETLQKQSVLDAEEKKSLVASHTDILQQERELAAKLRSKIDQLETERSSMDDRDKYYERGVIENDW